MSDDTLEKLLVSEPYKRETVGEDVCHQVEIANWFKNELGVLFDVQVKKYRKIWPEMSTLY